MLFNIVTKLEMGGGQKMQSEERRISTVWSHWFANPATGSVTSNVTGEKILLHWQLLVDQTNGYITTE